MTAPFSDFTSLVFGIVRDITEVMFAWPSFLFHIGYLAAGGVQSCVGLDTAFNRLHHPEKYSQN
jgi:hypothetical protein